MDQQFYNETERFFLQLPPEKTREYEKKIASYAEKCIMEFQIEVLKTMAEGGSKCAYEAFFCMTVIYRRNKDFEKLKEIIEQHANFKRHISYNHIWLQYLVHSETFYDYDELLFSAYRDAQLLSENAGYLQTFCNAFVTTCEQCNADDRQRIIDEWYDSALECINHAIELDEGYAKFYCTKARIISLKESFFEANRLINIAIAKENSKRPDYALTIMNYQSYKQSFALQQQRMEFNKRLKEMEEQLAALKESKAYPVSEEVPELPSVMEEASSVPKVLQAYTGGLPYVFISYAHGDQAEVYTIIEELQNAGIRIWFDKGIRPGAEWPEEIGNHLVKSSMVVVMLSSNSMQSANVRREVNLALSERIDLLVVVLDSTTLTPGMKLQFGLYQMISRFNCQSGQFLNELGIALGKDVGYLNG